MRNWAFLVCVLLAACATPQQRVAPPQFLFNDRAFSAPSERISADDVFALNDQMKRYLRTSIASQLQLMGMQQGLISALYQKDQLKLQYDVSMTRNASQAFDARAGNCLSLVDHDRCLCERTRACRSGIRALIWRRPGVAAAIFSCAAVTSM